MNSQNGRRQISRIKDLSFFAEAATVFVVRIDQENPQVRSRVEDALQDCGDTAGFSHPRCTDDGKMPAYQLLDVDMDMDVRILLQMTDVDPVAVRGTVDQLQFGVSQHDRGIADIRIFRDTALEVRASRLGANLADHVDFGHLAKRLAGARCGHRLFADLGNQADDQAFGRHDGHKFSNRCGIGPRYAS